MDKILSGIKQFWRRVIGRLEGDNNVYNVGMCMFVCVCM